MRYRPSNPANAPTPVEGVATVFGLVGEDFGRIHQLTSLLRDGGRMSAESVEPLRAGMSVYIGFEARGVIARRGVVERCERLPSNDEARFRVWIRFEISSREAA